MDFKEFVNKLEQDLKDAMADISPGAAVDVRSVEKLQDGSYTGITISPAGGNVGMNLNANQLFDQMQDLGCNQSSGRIWQRQSCDTFVSEKLTHKVEGLPSPKLWRTDILMSEMRE